MMELVRKVEIALFRIRAPRDRGATAVEYGIMIAAIAAVIVAVVIAMGGEVNDSLFQKVKSGMETIPN